MKIEKKKAPKAQGAGLNFLAQIASNATKKGSKKKSTNPSYKLSGEAAEAVDNLAAALQQVKDLEGPIAADKAIILEAFFRYRNAACQRDHKHYTTLRVQGNKCALSVTQTSRYSPMDEEAKAAALRVLEEEGFDEPEEAFSERFVTKLAMKFDSSALNASPEIAEKLGALLEAEPWLIPLFQITQEHYPLTTFHEGSALNEKEAKLWASLQDAGAIKPYAPSFKVG